MTARVLRPALLAAALLALLASSVAVAEVVQKGTVRVSVSATFSPQSLPRDGVAPISVSVGGQIATTDHAPAPKLKTLAIELNRHGRIDSVGLPTCAYEAIQTASTQRALATCRPALVGKGSFDAEITLPGQAPYPTHGELLAFNGKRGGKSVLFGQIYSPRPFATSFVIVFKIAQGGRGTFGTTLKASLPSTLRSWGTLTGIELNLSRRYTYRGSQHSYLSAGCPAPPGFSKATFPLTRTSFGFQDGQTLAATMVRSCSANPTGSPRSLTVQPVSHREQGDEFH
jgi:hypothetical protein